MGSMGFEVQIPETELRSITDLSKGGSLVHADLGIFPVKASVLHPGVSKQQGAKEMSCFLWFLFSFAPLASQ